MKVAICTATYRKPHPAYVSALKDSAAALDAAGIEHATVFEVNCPYISGARATMLSKAIKWGADAIVFIDDDVSWRPQDLVRLIQTPGDVVAGTYRFKKADEELYMGSINTDEQGIPVHRDDGCISAYRIPAGFLKVTRQAIEDIRAAYPHLSINDGGLDLFNHGAIDGIWHGEDYAFSKRWVDMGRQIWLIPFLCLDHHSRDDDTVCKGNFDTYLRKQPGGDLHVPA